jgi:hypothetical protein
MTRRQAIEFLSLTVGACAAPFSAAAGATDEALRAITVDNPLRFLAFVPKRGRKRA